jgi:integrase
VAKPVHHPALPYAELPAFMAELGQREGTAARALAFTILTAVRTGETIGAIWAEVDLEDKVWTIPADRMKRGCEHKVPLNERAIELLRALPTEEGNPHVFIGPRAGTGLSNMAMDAVLRRAGFKDRATVHGFRSTFRDWAAERTNFANHVVEMALAHAIGDKVEASYRRGDLFKKRQQLAEAWSRFCLSPPATGERVVPLREGARA